MQQDSIMTDPFQSYRYSCELIDNTSLNEGIKSTIKRVVRLTQAPPHWGCIKQGVEITKDLKLDQVGGLDCLLQTFNARSFGASEKPKKLATEYPVYFALRKIRSSSLATSLKKLVGTLYMDMFSLDHLDQQKLDPSIYYIDAYSVRDVLLQFLPVFSVKNESQQNLENFRKALLDRCPELIGQSEHDPTKHSKLNRFAEILSGERAPGKRQKQQKKKVSDEKPAVEKVPGTNDTTGQAVEFSFPTENSSDSKTVCRTSLRCGSQLSRSDDRRAIRGRVNGQAARNVISVADMHRLPLPLIARFLSTCDMSPECIVLGWLALTTGIAANRLFEIKLGAKGDPRIDPVTAIMSYTVRNRPDTKRQSRLLLQLNPLVGKSLLYLAARLPECEDQFFRLSRDFSLHHSGQTPTLERISASSSLHFSQDALSELEAAHLSGDIPAKLRAQAHYYPINVAEINRKYQRQHQMLAKRILGFTSCSGRFRVFLQQLEPFSQLPTGQLGSAHGLPVESLQDLLHAIADKARGIRERTNLALGFERPPLIVDFVQLQHMQLYILMQICLGMRKVGQKTSYAFAPSLSRGWGSEKASASFSVERKTVPLVDALKAQIEACVTDWQVFTKEAEAGGFLVERGFDLTNPLPLILDLDKSKRLIRMSRMSSSRFSELTNKYQLPGFPTTGSERIHPFKHLVARELVGKIPQVLLDELLSHDRDGLDLCSPQSTASASSLHLLSQAIEGMLSRLNFRILALGQTDD